MKVGSLFSGVGCGDLGLEWAGFDHAWFCEVDEYARKILALRWPGVPIYGDIKEIDFTSVPSIDVLAGGFPCQDISTAGTGKGIQGERSGLWSEYARAIGEIRPRYALIENSPALTTRGLDVVLSDLAALRYDAEWHCITASALGAPHKRDRIWIVAYPQGIGHGQWGEAIDISQTHGRQDGPLRPIFSGTGSEPQNVAESECNRRDARRNNDSKHDGAIIAADGQHAEKMADADLAGLKELDSATFAAEPRQYTGRTPEKRGETWWSVEPGLGRVANGTPHRVDRLRGIGNGQVPHCTYFIGQLIQEHARQTISKSADKNI